MPKAVIIVEDNQSLLSALKMALESEGYITFGALDGESALKKLHFLKGCAKDVVILSDLNMPNMSGIELAKEVGQDPAFAAVPVILMTAQQEITATSLEVIKKPFQIEDLVKVLDRNSKKDLLKIA